MIGQVILNSGKEAFLGGPPEKNHEEVKITIGYVN